MSEPTAPTLTRHADVRTVLASPRFAVPPSPAAPAGAPAGMAWLRAQVPRFSTGATHQRRRARTEQVLAGLDPARLRRCAADRTRQALAGAVHPVDLMAEVARAVPVTVLAEALGVTTPLWREVAVVATGYLPGTDAGAAGDEAVAHLVRAFGGVPDERTANLIGLLVQACEATAGLIGNAVLALATCPGRPAVDAALAETLRHDPPVRLARRVCLAPARIGATAVAAGTTVTLDVAAANRDPEVFPDPDRFEPDRAGAERHLTFGTGPRPCPGRGHALALAAGVVEAVRDRRVVDADPGPDSGALRVPARLAVAPR